MPLSNDQLPALKSAILAETDAAFVALRTAGNEQGMADWYNALTSPAFVVWRLRITRSELYNSTSAEGTTWDWATYKAQSVTEQGAWREMFMGDEGSPALQNWRTGVEKIFGVSNAQTAHVKAISKRTATRGERIYATGTGSTGTPGTPSYEGQITAQNISDALRS